MANSILVDQIKLLASRSGAEAATLRAYINNTADNLSDMISDARSDLTTDIATAKSESALDFNTKIGTLTALTTTAQGSLVLAVNEVKGLADTAQAAAEAAQDTADAAVAATAGLINDTAASATKVYSSQKTDLQIKTAVDAVVDGATDALNTLKELATALGDDANFAGTVSTALGKRISVAEAQVFTPAELAQAQGNLDVFSKAQVTAAIKVVSDSIGDLNNLDLVALFEAELPSQG